MSNRLLGLLLTLIVAFGIVGLFITDKPVRLTFTVTALVLAVATLVAHRRTQKVRWKPRSSRDEGFGLIDTILAVIIMALMSLTIVQSVAGDVSQAAVAACQSDGATVEIALQQFTADNSLFAGTWSPVDFTNSTPTNTTPPTGVNTTGYPFLETWPSNTGHYWYGIASSATNISTVVFASGTATVTAVTGSGFTVGEVYLAPAGAASPPAAAAWVAFNGPASCTGGTGNATIK